MAEAPSASGLQEPIPSVSEVDALVIYRTYALGLPEIVSWVWDARDTRGVRVLVDQEGTT
jgi:hypothetical protein